MKPKGEKKKETIIVGVFNTPFSVIDRRSRKLIIMDRKPRITLSTAS
jgi:hypothetical protein